MNDGKQVTGLHLVILTLIRTVLNTSYRMVYPFLSTFQSGLGISLGTFSLLLTLRSLVGLISPLAAPLADWRGRKLSMLLGLGCFTLGAVLVVIFPTVWAFFAAVLAMTLGTLVFLPAVQAYIGDRVPYHRRGRAMGFTELSWSLAFILGVPAVGWLLGRSGSWQVPFPFLALLGGIAIAATIVLIPSDRAAHSQSSSALSRSGLRQVLAVPSVPIGLAMGLMMTGANETVNLVFGLWLEGAFGLKLAALGAASAVLGIAELGGEGLSTGLVDRLGKERSVRAGLLLNSLASVALVFSGGAVWSAILALFFFYLSFEFTIVSVLPLYSEILPSLRATVMASAVASFSVGRAIGALIGPLLFSTWSFPANAAAAVLFNLAAIFFLSRLKIAQPATEVVDPA